MKTFRRLLGITWKEKKTNEYVWNQVKEKLQDEKMENIVDVLKRRKLTFFGHHIRANRILKTLIQGKVEGERKRGKPRRSWSDDLVDWTGLSLADLCREAENRTNWRARVSTWVHQRPYQAAMD